MTCLPSCSCGCCCAPTTAAPAGSEVMSVFAAFFKGVFILGKGAWLLCRYVLGPGALVLSVLAWRWFSGAALTGRALPSTFRRGAVAPALPPRRFGLPRLYWAYWPGWQRAVVRTVATALAAGLLLWPLATLAAVTLAVTATAGCSYRQSRKRRRPVPRRSRVIRVVAQVGPPVAELTGTSSAPTWSAAAAGEAVAR